MKNTYSLIAVAILLAGCTQVPSGTVGVEKTWSKVNPQPVSEGLVWYNPIWTDIGLVSTQPESFAAEAKGSSRDLQNVKTTVTVTVGVNGALAPKLIASIGTLERFSKTILAPGIQESVKAITAGYTAEHLITDRATVKKQIDEAIAGYVEKVLKEKDVENAVLIQQVAITNFEFSHEFDASIESKVKAEQDALRAVNEKTKRITESQAAAIEKQNAADASAYTTTVNAKAEADAITANSLAKAAALDREGQMLAKNPLVVELRKIERWDGILPRYSLGSSQSLIQLPQDEKK